MKQQINSQSNSQNNPTIKPNPQFLPPNILEAMMGDIKVRRDIVNKSHLMFFNCYFSHYLKYPTAHFHKEFFFLTEQDNLKKLFIVAFRGSAKSSIFTMSYPLWAILGQQQKKFVLIICQTRAQAKQHMMNLKHELEGNFLLKNDLGPFQEESNEWGSISLVFSKLDARITAASSEQSIRGLRHRQHRPNLIIGDDLEDLASVKTREGRQKIYQWLTSEAIPAGDKDTRIIIIGNLLHEDSLLMHLRQDIKDGIIDGIFKFYPLVNQAGETVWPGKYPTKKDIEDERKKVGNEVAWQREYLLRILPTEDQVICPKWIQYYDILPLTSQGDYMCTCAGVDLAISEKSTADYTAIVAAQIHGQQGKRKIYILPNPVNKRMLFPDLVDFCKGYLKTLQNGKLLIENVAFQASLSQLLFREGNHVEGVPVHGDKRSRLSMTSPLIQNGTVLFPRKGCEELIQQLTGFGVEKFDDLADAFTLLINKLVEDDNKPRPNMWLIDEDGNLDSAIHYDDD